MKCCCKSSIESTSAPHSSADEIWMMANLEGLKKLQGVTVHLPRRGKDQGKL
jgi:hypothetical protein